jgi:endonuclease I
VSSESSYSLPYALSVQQIQGVGVSSPEVGSQVITSGVVTGAFGATFVIQDGTGPRSGLWVNGAAAPAVGSAVQVLGQVQELNGNTTLASAQIVASFAGSLPAAEILATGTAGAEDWEGVLVRVVDAACTLSDAETPRWEINNGAGTVAVDDLAVAPGLVLGTRYTVTGPMSGQTTAFGIVPRTAGDIVLVGDTAAPMVVAVTPLGPTGLQVTFTEAVSAASAQTAANYVLDGGAALSAVLTPGQPSVLTLTVAFMANGNHSLAINGVADLYGNTVSGLVLPFAFYGGSIPAAYYTPAEGLLGEPLRLALHNIIDGHSSVSYAGLWTAFYTTDVKPNGKVWDMYSDIPGGTPPYEYTLGVDQGGSAGSEGTGYNREHSWPSSWYGAISPMYTDLFIIYPTDNDVNNRRGNYPYGEVASPTWTSLNGSRLGACSYPGYSGTVFEPIDDYKGDFARAYFYMTTRYFGEDASWPGSPAVSGAVLLPWTEALLLDWNASDPVSAKEIDRNEAVYAIQGNRNPFIDRPDFVAKVFQPELSPVLQPVRPAAVALFQNVPNPFNPATTISYELDRASGVQLQVFDLGGRLVQTLVQGTEQAGRHDQVWQGRDQADRPVAAGVYFYRLRADEKVQTRRMLLVK